MYLASNKAADNQAIYQYTLSTAYDVSTASYASISFPDPYSNDMRGMSWKSDGSTWVRASDDGAGGGVQKAFVQFNPSTAWDISTSGSVANTFLVNSYQAGVKDCIFGNSGNQVTSLSDNNTLNTYDLSTAYDISTASNTSKDQSLNSIDNAARSHAWNSDGTKCYYLGVQNNKVYTLDCSTPWNITTMTHTASNDIDISGQTTAAYGIDTSGGVSPTSIIVGSTSSPYTVYEYGDVPFAGSVLATIKQ
jgi:WD40 repeat protein